MAYTVVGISVLFLIIVVAADSRKSTNKAWYNASQDKTLLLNVERVLRRDDLVLDIEDEAVYSKRIATYLKSVSPPFAVTDAPSDSKCWKDSISFLRGIDSLEMWALTMYDSSSKIQSGLLNGNVNHFGDFDRCLSVNDPQADIQGKYCLAHIQVHLQRNIIKSHSLFQVYDLMHSHGVFRSHLNDSGHRVPRYSTINWALCVPSSCSATDVQTQLKNNLFRFMNSSSVQLEIKVDSSNCQVQRSYLVSFSFIIAAIFITSFIILAILATFYDTSTKDDQPGAVTFLSCFSLRRNWNQLFTYKRESNDIATIHGIRMLNSIMLLLSHKSMALFFQPYSNRTRMTEALSQQWTVLARAAALYTDPFIMISGLLTGLSLIKSLRRDGTINIRREYSNRLTRIVPSLIAIIIVCTFLLPELGSGPQWNLAVNHHAEKCKQYWWRNLLFIHNYFGFNDMCLTHTHHIGIDTQLFLLSPLLVWIVHKWKSHGIAALIGLAAISTGYRYYTTVVMKLSYFIYPGISNLQMIQTADHSYAIPFHRLSMYIMGILLAYVMDYCGKDYKLKRNVRRLGWMVALSLFYYSYIKPSSMGVLGYQYSEYDAGLYAALAPIGWSLMFAWVIFISNIGYGGVVGDIFSQKFGPIWTRLSYAIYLTQFPIYFYNVGLQRSSQEYQISVVVNVWENVVIFMASVALVLFIEYPFNNLRRWLLKK